MATSLGWVLGGLILPELALFSVGLVTGILQWVVLRQYLPQAGWWVLASAAGWAGGWALIGVAPLQPGILAEPLLGAAVGTLQWLVLRRQLRQAGWWIVISALSWTVALTGLTGELLVGAVVGAVTGIALELLLRYPGLRKTH
ncbi:MAG: hypothetical protein Kow0063_10930 [Anaerolineae bacterium]